MHADIGRDTTGKKHPITLLISDRLQGQDIVALCSDLLGQHPVACISTGIVHNAGDTRVATSEVAHIVVAEDGQDGSLVAVEGLDVGQELGLVDVQVALVAAHQQEPQGRLPDYGELVGLGVAGLDLLAVALECALAGDMVGCLVLGQVPDIDPVLLADGPFPGLVDMESIQHSLLAIKYRITSRHLRSERVAGPRPTRTDPKLKTQHHDQDAIDLVQLLTGLHDHNLLQACLLGCGAGSDVVDLGVVLAADQELVRVGAVVQVGDVRGRQGDEVEQAGC